MTHSFSNSEIDKELSLNDPWYIVSCENKIHTNGEMEYHIHISYRKGAKFHDNTNQLYVVKGTKNKTWLHKYAPKFLCYIHGKIPQIKKLDGKFEYIAVPWSRTNSRFTWVFEKQIMQEILQGIPFDKIGESIGKDKETITRILSGWIDIAYPQDTIKDDLQAIGLDEISTTNRKITAVIDLHDQRVLHVVPTQGETVFAQIHSYLTVKGFDPQHIQHITGPFSHQHRQHMAPYFPHAQYHVDQFYIIEALNKALEAMIQQETKFIKNMAENKDLILAPQNTLSDTQHQRVSQLLEEFPNLGRAYAMKERFYQLWQQTDGEKALAFLHNWHDDLSNTRMLKPLKLFSQTLMAHQSHIINFCQLPTSQDAFQHVHAQIISAIKRTKGLTNLENATNMIYFCAGKLTLPYPIDQGDM